MMFPIIGDAIQGVISTALGPLFTRLIDLIPDPAEKARQAALLQQQLMAADAAMISQQNAINLAEAGNANIFVAGWRPMVGWVCAMGLGWQVIAAPFLTFVVNALGYYPTLPAIDSSYISMLLIPLLGLGALRTVERLGKVNSTTLGN